MKTNVPLKTMNSMKKYSILLSAVLAVLALGSCLKEQETAIEEATNNGPASVPFQLRATIPAVEDATKTSLNTSTWAVSWEDTDVIYAVTTDEEWGVAYSSDNDGNTIADFTYDSGTGKFSTDLAISDGSHTFNFLYTAGQQRSYHRGASSTFSLAGAQSFDASNPTASLKLYDALAAQVTVTTPTSFADVDMSHLFSLMKVTLNNKTGASVTINKFEVEIPGQNLYGVFNVTFGTTPSVAYNKNGGDKITVNISNGTVANNGSLDVYFVMGPVSGYTGEVTFTVTDSADNTYTKTNTISAPGVTFAAGTYNTANYTIKAVDPPMVTSWVETAIGSLAANDVIAIVDKTSSTAMTNDNGTSNPPAASSVTISGSNITSAVADNMQWVFEIPSAGNYSFKKPGSTNYLYTTNANNGVRVGSNSDNVFTFVENDGNSTYYLVNSATSRYLGVYTTTPDWRCYTSVNANITDTRTAFYKKSSVAATEYTVSVTTPSNGTVTTSPSGKAYETSTVTITATPDDGYTISDVSVVDASSNVVATTPVDATHYSFTMPSANVTITVTFARVYTITATASNGTIDVSPATTAVAGETITITATPNTGYVFDSWSVTGATPASTTTNPTTFTMPAGNVSVSATFVAGATPLDAPDNVTISAIDADGFTASWDEVAEADGYYWTLSTSSTYAGIAPANTLAEDAIVGSSTHSVTESVVLTAGTTYYFYVVAVGDGVTTDDSEPASTSGSFSADKTYTVTFAKGTTFTTNVTSYTSSFVNTCDGLALTIANVNNGGNSNWTEMRAGRKTTASTPTITSNSAISEAIKTVTIHITQVETAAITSAKLYVSSSSTFATKDSYDFKITGTGDVSATVTTPSKDKYYQIEIVTNDTGSANGHLRFDKLVYSTK